PGELKITPNHHYNGSFLEPWGDRSERGYGIEILRRFFEEVAFVEFGGPPAGRAERLAQMNALAYNDLATDRDTVAVIQALEALLEQQAHGARPGVVEVNGAHGGLELWTPGQAEPAILYSPPV